jgi:hypothetical protein
VGIDGGGLLPAVSWTVDAGDAGDADADAATEVRSVLLSSTPIVYSADASVTALAKSADVATNLAKAGVNAYAPGSDGGGPGLFAALSLPATGIPTTSVPVFGYPTDGGIEVLANAAKAQGYTIIAIGDPQTPYNPANPAGTYLGFRFIAIKNNP